MVLSAECRSHVGFIQELISTGIGIKIARENTDSKSLTSAIANVAESRLAPIHADFPSEAGLIPLSMAAVGSESIAALGSELRRPIGHLSRPSCHEFLQLPFSDVEGTIP